MPTTVGPNGPSTGVDDSSAGSVAWTSPGNITASDTNRASCTIGINTQTHYAKGTGFGFSIPTSTVNGILLEVLRCNVGATQCTDNRIRLVRAGVVETADKATLTTWPFTTTNEAYATYGGSSDLWSASWAPADINDSGFGGVVSAKRGASKGAAAPSINYLRISTTYTVTAAATNGNFFLFFCLQAAMFVSFPLRNMIAMNNCGQRLSHYMQSCQTRDTRGGKYLDPVAGVLNALNRRPARRPTPDRGCTLVALECGA